ncbi:MULTISPECIES: hypothetical protein [unclassified Stenotrophomonas]|uniref:hypothetical protein n=1 Tax=unclassified Stenotrophomonas TaxID=196198 RepID=UPI000D162CE3|nr:MULTISPECIES: hypothetical protein [unclassified Stenotrophomonas]PTA71331.1 hypothetical protein C9412_12440 [Stenotrophomonas sp. Nf1]PTA79742.1 hypothetical protein C9416_11680 [Stenotrophomonas sp. Nf4]
MRSSCLLLAVFLLPGTAVAASDDAASPRRPSVETLQRLIVDKAPQTRVETPDSERITARRIDIVDDQGVIRMTLSGKTPAPIIDGIQYKRAFNVAGMVLYDDKGSERGGFGTADVDGGMAVLALDHPAMDAIGWRVSPDGQVSFSINQAPKLIREPALDNKLIPGVQAPTRIGLVVGADGTPAIALNDKADRTRLRLTVTAEGYGAIEFLDAQGKVIHTLAPEAELRR